MSRFRVEAEKVISQSKDGPIKAVIVANDKALALFSIHERMLILKASISRAGKFWLDERLPMRFSDYAHQLGYRVSVKYEKSKRHKLHGDEPQPLVYTSELYDAAMQGSTAKGMASGENTAVLIRIPVGEHQLAMVVQRVLKTIPNEEIKMIAHEFEKTLIAIINNADHSDSERSRLITKQRSVDRVKIRTPRVRKKRTVSRGLSRRAYENRVILQESAED